MSDFNKQVNNILAKMRTGDVRNKGNQGELAALAICEKFYQKYGGLLYHSYAYKTDSSLPGNVKRDGGSLYIERLGDFTEIDILYVSPFRVFPIEVKSYRAKEITLTDDGIHGSAHTEKSPVHQNEMHARHLLSGIFEALPDGDENYIRPIVVFVDKCTLIDKRSQWQRTYIPKSTLNKLADVISANNTPLNNKLINLRLMESKLKAIEVSIEKELPPRYV